MFKRSLSVMKYFNVFYGFVRVEWKMIDIYIKYLVYEWVGNW